MKKLKRNNQFKIPETTWDEELEMPDGSYSLSNIQHYFQYFHYETLVDKPPVQKSVNKIKKRITFKIKTKSYFDFLTPETIKLLESAERIIPKDRNSDNVPQLQIVETVLVKCYIVNNQLQQYIKVSCPHFSQISASVSY